MVTDGAPPSAHEPSLSLLVRDVRVGEMTDGSGGDKMRCGGAKTLAPCTLCP